jgi:hypothetical protein
LVSAYFFMNIIPISTLEEVLSDINLRACGSRYNRDLPNRWDTLSTQLAKDRFVVPVMGVQGSGKSTLLTALLFDRPVLPVDADETTCVPVEIVYGTSNTAVVSYVDGHKEEVPATEEELSRFVHQESNPGNRLNVKKVVVQSASPLLRSGVVLVDLPGLGSLTKANAETALAYLNESSGLIYLLRTVPPVTRSEALSLSLIWPRLPIIFFAQNRWTDEGDEEAEEGRSHNSFVIGDLAQRLGRTLDESQKHIDIVCAYRALDGMLSRDATKVEQSAINAFKDRLDKAFGGWPTLVRTQLTAAVHGDLGQCRALVLGRIGDLSADQADGQKALEGEFARQGEALANLGRRIATVKEHLDEFIVARRNAVRAWHTESRSVLRNRMRTLMRKGIVDGPRLDKALVDEQQATAEPAYEAAREAVLDAISIIGKDLASEGDWAAGGADGLGVGKEESKRFENLIGRIAGAAGGIGGYVAGAAAGAKLGAAFGLVGGPAGVAIGVVLGAVGGALGAFLASWLGGQAADAVLAARAKANEVEVFRVIDQYTDAVNLDLSRTATEFADTVHKNLRDWHSDGRRRSEEEHASRSEAINGGVAERAARLSELQRDLGCLEAGIARLMRREG